MLLLVATDSRLIRRRVEIIRHRGAHCTRTSPLPLLPSGPGGIGGIASRGTRCLGYFNTAVTSLRMSAIHFAVLYIRKMVKLCVDGVSERQIETCSKRSVV